MKFLISKYCLMVLILFITLPLFGEDESWFSTGMEYSHIFQWSEHDSEKNYIHIISKGIALSGYIFNDENRFGMFFHSSLLAPFDSNQDSDFKNADLNIGNSLFIGPAYRGPEFHDLFQPYGGFGLHYLQYTFHDSFVDATDTYDIFQFYQYLGLGGEIGCKLNFTDYFYLGIGTILAWDFLNISIDSFDGETNSEVPDRFNALWIDPFLSVGFMWRGEKSD